MVTFIFLLKVCSVNAAGSNHSLGFEENATEIDGISNIVIRIRTAYRRNSFHSPMFD